MKQRLILLLAFVSGVVFTMIISWEAQDDKKLYTTDNPDINPVLAIRKIKLKSGVTADAFEKFAAKVANDEFGKLPGVKFYYGKGERGDEPNSYVLFMDFDSKTTRNFYAPSEDDDSKRTPEAAKMVNDYFTKYSPEFDKLAEVVTPAGKKGYVDYIILK